jgi:hypothetical protein
MTQDDIILMDRVLTNSVQLYRFTAGERSKVIALLKRMTQDLRAQIAEREGETFTKSRLRTLLKQSETVINDYYAAIGKGLNDQLEALAVIETDKTAAIFKGTELAVNLPTTSTLKTIVSDSLVMGTPTSEWWSRQASGLVFQYSAQVRLGVTAGETNAQIQKRVMPLLEVSKRNAATLVHDSVQTIANDARLAFFKENDEIFKGLKQISTLDSKTSDICMAYSGAEWTLDGDPIGDSPAFNGGPPRHFNAIAKGELVKTEYGNIPIEHIAVGDMVMTHKGRLKPVTAVMSKRNKGGVIRVITLETGNIVRATDEHPVLTSNRGWLRADMLQPGDQLFKYSKKPMKISPFSIAKRNPDDYPAPFNTIDVFDKISIEPGSMSSAINFNDNLFINKSEVSNTTALDKLARISAYTNGVKKFNKTLLTFWHCFKLKPLTISKYSIHCTNLVSWIINSHPLRVPCIKFAGFLSEAISPTIYTRGLSGSMKFFDSFSRCFTLSPCFDAVFPAPVLNNGFANAKVTLNLSERFTKGKMLFINKLLKLVSIFKVNHFDTYNVSGIRIVDYNEDVYNLSVEDDETYLINDIIVHNCRSVLVGIRRTYRELGINIDEIKKTTRASDEGQIAASTTFDQFLNRKTIEQQNEMLGKGKAQLWRDGKITLRDLLDQSGRPLTLEELKHL